MSGRRELTFADLEEVMPEVERLLEGHIALGRWSLAQVCNHLAAGIRLTLDAPIRPARPSPEKELVRYEFFRRARFPDGMEVPIARLVPGPDLDAAAEAESLRREIARFSAHDGSLPAHPRLGPVIREEWARFHCMHCAHHLGFLVPGRSDRPGSA